MAQRKPTPRTATTKWKNLRLKVLQRAQRNGVTSCPECGVTLDYKRSLQRNSAEVDHIKPVAQGGTDTITNLRVCCRRCNQSLGAKKPKAPKTKTELPGWSDTAHMW